MDKSTSNDITLITKLLTWFVIYRATRQVMSTEIPKCSMVKSLPKGKSPPLQQCHPLVQRCSTLQRLSEHLSEEHTPQAVQTRTETV